MTTVIVVIAVSIAAVWMEIPAILDLRQFKEAVLFVLLTVAAVVLFVLQALHVPLPNPLEWISIG